tara:strand:+ start:1035 stop:1391 length:357 start_codon:yes stop_codon:yes gene_type:complete
MTDIYSLQFDPHKLSHQQEQLGLEYSDNDTALEILKKEEKLIVAELTLHYSKNIKYKNTSELQSYIHSDKRFRDFVDRYSKTLKVRNRSKVRYETFKTFREDLRSKSINEVQLARHNI